MWDSLRQRAGVLGLSEDERIVIEARRAEHRVDPTSTDEWESVRADLLNDQSVHDARFLVGADSLVIEKALIEANLSGTLADVRAGRPAPPHLGECAGVFRPPSSVARK